MIAGFIGWLGMGRVAHFSRALPSNIFLGLFRLAACPQIITVTVGDCHLVRSAPAVELMNEITENTSGSLYY